MTAESATTGDDGSVVSVGATPNTVPALDRAMSIFELFSRRPLDRMTLSEISRATGIHKATCSSMLSTLTHNGMVHRDTSRRYAIGSTFLRYSYAYAQRFAPLVRGRTDMLEFVAHTQLSCAMLVRQGDEIVILEILGNTQPAHLRMRIGERVPLVPPVGMVFKTWGEAAELESYLEAMEQAFGGERTAHEASLAMVRARGYSLGGEHDFQVQLADALGRAAHPDGEDGRILEIAMIVAEKIRNFSGQDHDESEPVNSVIAPVFDAGGRVIASINAFGEFGTVRVTDLARIVPALLATAIRITQKIGGRLPRGFPAD